MRKAQKEKRMAHPPIFIPEQLTAKAGARADSKGKRS